MEDPYRYIKTCQTYYLNDMRCGTFQQEWHKNWYAFLRLLLKSINKEKSSIKRHLAGLITWWVCHVSCLYGELGHIYGEASVSWEEYALF